jgi:hypothetical protein
MVRILPGSIVTAEALQLAAREQWVGFRLGDVPGLSQSFCRHEGYFGVSHRSKPLKYKRSQRADFFAL